MSGVLAAPENFRVVGKDGCSVSEWNPVTGADGYKLFFFESGNAEKCIKTRYAGMDCKKTILGFRNGKEYLCCVCAFKYENGREVSGECTGKISFIPVCTKLKAQNTICLSTGQKAQIICENKVSMSDLAYLSENPTIASVDSSGVVNANANGTAYVKISAPDNQTFRTKVVVGRNNSHGINKAVVMLAGDIMCAVNHQRKSKDCLFDFGDAFSDNVRKIMSDADYSIGVLETSCYDLAPYEFEQLRLDGGSPNCNSPSSFISALAGAGFNGLVTANNHNCDTGLKGLRATVSEIKRLGMQNFGTLGDNPVIIEIKGIKVAVLSCCMISNGLDEESEIVNAFGRYDRNYFVELVNRAYSLGAEYIIAYQHWGTMNSRTVNKSQLNESRFMAEAGADLIVGSHPHMVQKFTWIKTSGGKKVPCLYSLGNFLTSMSEFPDNRDSAFLRAELTKENGKVKARLSYIPCCCEDRPYGVAVVSAYPPHSEDTKGAFSRIKMAVGTGINHFVFRPKVLLFGSSNLEKIFGTGRDFRVDKSAVHISQLSLGSETVFSGSNNSDRTLALEIGKNISEFVTESGADYVAVDFVTASTVSCYRYSDVFSKYGSYFTNTKKFRNSDFFRLHQSELKRIKPPFSERVWKPLLRNFAQKLLECVSGDRVVLFRSHYSDTRAKKNQLRSIASSGGRNGLCKAMEDYFIELVNPAVVDLSKEYFPDSESTVAFENHYYEDAYRAAKEIIIQQKRHCVIIPDANIWFSRVMKYYDNMTARSYQSRLLDMNSAADQIIAYTSKEFSALNSRWLISLHNAGNTDLSSVHDFFVNECAAESVIRAAEIIDNIQHGKLDRSYDFYQPAFSGKWNILKTLVRRLSAEIGAPVNESRAELVFLLRGKTQLKRYIANLDRITLDIWGSCISRESINHCENALVGKYIFKQCPVLAYESPIEADFPEGTDAFCGNAWRKKMLVGSFSKNGFDIIDTSKAYFIVVDFYDVICKMAEYRGGLFEIDDFIGRTDFYKNIHKECSECYLFQKRNMKYCADMIARFAKDIFDRYGENIILIKSEPKNRFINLDYRLQDMEEDPLFEIKHKFISLCEEQFANLTGCYVIDISKRFYSSDMFPLGGAHIVHYEDEFYKTVAKYISQIITGTKQKIFNAVDENYILLRDLKLER